MPDRRSSLVASADFRPSLCAGACRGLLAFVAPKGQEKGNVPKVSTLCLLKSPFLLRQLMLRPRMGTLLGDDVGVRIFPPDPASICAFPCRASARDPGVAALLAKLLGRPGCRWMRGDRHVPDASRAGLPTVTSSPARVPDDPSHARAQAGPGDPPHHLERFHDLPVRSHWCQPSEKLR